MKVSKNWLGEYLNLNNISDEELFNKISSHICEIESYKKLVDATNLTIGYVRSCDEHPNSDHLHVCQVEINENEVKQIICGAPNVAAGKKVIVANIGAVLPGDFVIKPSKIRGMESFGMLCSLQELGIEEKYVEEEYKNGIYLLDDEAPVGGNPLEYLNLDDIVIDLDLTSNRSDLLSIEGVAYDLGAVLNQKIATIIPDLEEDKKENPIKVSVNTSGCSKYLMRVIENVTIAKSPQWLRARLIASGIRPINNVVDITNYVLLEMGQPLHAFDYDRLGNSVIVRNAFKGEKLTTLDDIKRDLLETDIVIANENEALCLAGVMGGLTSEVENETRNVALEAACFEPLLVRKTSSRLGLKSESSVRFERGIDFERVDRALDYAAQLICEIAGGKVLSGVSKVVNGEFTPKQIKITSAKINSVLGTSLKEQEIEDIFNRLDYTYSKMDNIYNIVIPSRRPDIEDTYQSIIEDVVRMYGYDNIPTTLAKTDLSGGLNYSQRRQRKTKEIFASMGFNEVSTYSLVAEKDLGLYIKELGTNVALLMPMTEDHAVMRQSLLNGVVDAICYNKARKVENLALFEVGNTYTMEKETLKLAGALSGCFISHLWRGEKQISDFYVLKGLLDVYFSKMNIEVVYKPYNELSNLHPGRTASINYNGKMIGFIGELHPRFAKKIGASNTVVFEIELEEITSLKENFDYSILNKYPTVTRDLAIVVKKDVLADSILDVVRQAAKKNLVNIEVFDVYTGGNVASDEKSLAIKLTFEDKTKTLESSDVDKINKSILNRLDYYFNAKLRD